MRGGIKVYRGSAAAARHYVEADRSRADDYYLAEGTGLAARFVAGPDGLEPGADRDASETVIEGALHRPEATAKDQVELSRPAAAMPDLNTRYRATPRMR